MGNRSLRQMLLLIGLTLAQVVGRVEVGRSESGEVESKSIYELIHQCPFSIERGRIKELQFTRSPNLKNRVLQLTQVLRISTPNSDLRNAAIGELMNMDYPIIPHLLPLINEPDPSIQSDLLAVLSHEISSAQTYLEIYQRSSQDSQQKPQPQVIGELKAIDYSIKLTVTALIPLLRHSNPDIQSKAAAILGRTRNSAKPALPMLLSVLQDKDSTQCVRLNTASAIMSIGAETLPEIIPLLNHSDDRVRWISIYIISGIGKPAQSTLPKLISFLDDPKPGIRGSAAFAIGKMGELSSPALPALILRLKDPDPFVRRQASSAIGDIGESANKALPDLMALLDDPDTQVRWRTVDTIGKMNQFATPAIPLLIKAFNDTDKTVRSSAVRAIADLQEAGIPLLIKALDNPNPRIRSSAAEAIRDIVHRTQRIDIINSVKPTIPTLITFLNDSDPEVRSNAAFVLVSLGELAQPAIPSLIARLQDSQREVRGRSIDALIYAGKPGRTALAQSIPALTVETKFSIVDTLNIIGHQSKTQVMGQDRRHLTMDDLMVIFTPLLNDPNPEVRSNTAEVLKKLGYKP